MKYSITIKPECLQKGYCQFIDTFPEGKIPVTSGTPSYSIEPHIAATNNLNPEDHRGFSIDTSRLTPEQYLAVYQLFFKGSDIEKYDPSFGNQPNPLRIVGIDFRHVDNVFAEQEGDLT